MIPDAPRVTIPPLPQAPIFQEVYEYRVNSSGYARLEQCILVETAKVLKPEELGAWHYVYHRGVGENIIQQGLGISEKVAEALANIASAKFSEYQSNTRDPINYCMAQLRAEELSSGNIQQRFVRNHKLREGKPLGLENIDVSQPRPVVKDKFDMEQAQMKAEIDEIKRQQPSQLSAQELLNEMKSSDKFKQAKSIQEASPESVNHDFIMNACINAENTADFCKCFVKAFGAQIGNDNIAAALPVIANGVSDTQAMSLMREIDQTTYMQDMMKVQNISSQCE